MLEKVLRYIFAYEKNLLAFCNTYTWKRDLIFEFLIGKEFTHLIFELILFFISVSLFITSIYQKHNHDQLANQNKYLMSIIKNDILDQIKIYSLKNVGLRLFMPKYNFLVKLMIKRLNIINVRKIFYYKEIKFFTDAGVFKDLSFRVEGTPQGLVGRCYKTKSVISENDLSKVLGEESYGFDYNHKKKLRNIKFCLCVPIFEKKDGQNFKVVAVFQIDSSSKWTLNEDKKEKLSKDIYFFIQSLYDECESFFK